MVTDSSSTNLHRQAIDAALKCDWEQAIQINQELIKEEPENVECLNRLAKAYLELGQYSDAKKLYQQVLEIDEYNTIAQKNLKRVSSFDKANIKSNGSSHSMILSAALFLEEPGITQSVSLIKVAEPQKLMMLSAGQEIFLSPKSRGISIIDHSNQYLGALPDDTAHHLQRLLAGGNKYQVLIKSVKSNGITVLIREVFRSKKFRNQASFISSDSKVLSYSSDHIRLVDDAVQDDSEESSDSEEVVI